MANLLTETLDDIKLSGHVVSDVVFIGSRHTGHRCTWDEFCHIANVDYHSGYGAQKVASDLEIVFSDGGGMTRGEYDGAEWWEYYEPFQAPETSHSIASLVVWKDQIGWKTLQEIQDVQ